jgi:hypothetical protein
MLVLSASVWCTFTEPPGAALRIVPMLALHLKGEGPEQRRDQLGGGVTAP